MTQPVSEHEAASAVARDALIAIGGVTKRYARRAAIENLALTLRSGDVFGLVGANGGGKTTTLRVVAGLLSPDEGQGKVLGFDLRRGAREIRTHVGYMSQRFSLYADLSVFENLRFRAQVYGLRRPRAAADAMIEEFELTSHARSAAGGLSGGWARRLVQEDQARRMDQRGRQLEPTGPAAREPARRGPRM